MILSKVKKYFLKKQAIIIEDNEFKACVGISGIKHKLIGS